jgi:hypothetical protein
MQRTRDRVGLHGKAPGREPLIFVVRLTEIGNVWLDDGCQVRKYLDKTKH